MPEFVRVVFIAVAAVVLQMVVSTDLTKVENWKVWAIGIGAAAVHAAGVAILAVMTPSPPSA